MTGLNKRLYFGVKEALVGLMEIPGVKLGRAKLLHSKGFTCAADVCKLPTDELARKLGLPEALAGSLRKAARHVVTREAQELRDQGTGARRPSFLRQSCTAPAWLLQRYRAGSRSRASSRWARPSEHDSLRALPLPLCNAAAELLG